MRRDRSRKRDIERGDKAKQKASARAGTHAHGLAQTHTGYALVHSLSKERAQQQPMPSEEKRRRRRIRGSTGRRPNRLLFLAGRGPGVPPPRAAASRGARARATAAVVGPRRGRRRGPPGSLIFLDVPSAWQPL